jgi:ubiquinone/menaquinone biosynthesis C-methylase UbiE
MRLSFFWTKTKSGVPGGAGDRRLRRMRFMFAPCVEFVVEHGGPHPVVLDVGTGSGIILEHVRERLPEARLIGVDLRREPMELGDQIGIALIQGDAQYLPLKNDSVDVVVCRSSFLYYDDHAQVLKEMQRVLKPGGSAYITDPVPGPLRRLVVIALGLVILHRGYSEMATFADRSLSRDQLVALLAGVGITDYGYRHLLWGTYYALTIRKPG